MCVWCWGNEPVMRAIDYLYGNKVNVEYIMGGLIEEISTLYDLKGSKRQVIERANAIMAEHWLMASERHGMPVNTRHMALFSERYPSSFPQNIAYEAARRIDAAAAKRFLRRIREATFVEARRTSQIDVLIELAADVGIDAARFIDQYTAGEAQADFSQSRMRCRRNGITGFPSYLIKCSSTKITLSGYQNISTFHTIIGRLSNGKIKPRRLGPSVANVTDFMRRYQTAYPAEIEVAFGLDRDRTDLMIEELIRSGRLTSEQVGNGRRLTVSSTAKTYPTARRAKNTHHDSAKAAPENVSAETTHKKVEQKA